MASELYDARQELHAELNERRAILHELEAVLNELRKEDTYPMRMKHNAAYSRLKKNGSTVLILIDKVLRLEEQDLKRMLGG